MSRLIYVIAFTPSFERMRQFYENSLDLKVKGEKKNWVEYDTGGARFALHSIGPEKRGIQLRFEAKNIERECADMTKRGVRFEHDVESYEWGKFNEAWDPEGRLLSWLAPTRAFQPGGGMKLGTVILNAEEFGRAATFYRDHVGLPVVADRDHWIEFDTGDTRTALHFRGNGDDAPLHASPKISFAFEVKDLDKHARRLRERGVHFASAPREEEFGVFAELLDPDGNVVVIREPVPMPSLEEELAEPFEDDGEPARASMRRPVRKDAKATSRVALRPDYKTRGAKAQTVGTKKKSSKDTKPRSARGAGPERTRVEPKSKRDPKRARNRPATGRQKKAERKTFAEKKRAVAGASKSKPVKRAARPAKKK
jgi:catechol 2,3-dioxygenase-like lactoylglutathione lyase family enzyme